MNQDSITVRDYQILRAIAALDQETRTRLTEFLRTHMDSDIESFKAGLTEILAKQE